MPRVVTFMKVLGGAVALGTAITIPFVIHDIISKSKGEGEENKQVEGGPKGLDINCRVEESRKDLLESDSEAVLDSVILA